MTTGLYTFKAGYAELLTPLRRSLAVRRVSPETVSWTSVGFAAVAAGGLALLPGGVVAGALVTLALAGRLACANLDGGLARLTGRCSRRGLIVNEVSDRLADLVMLAGAVALGPAWLVGAALAAATLPSWVSLLAASGGARRRQGGPCGKTERCLVMALIGFGVPAAIGLSVIVIGSLATAALRLRSSLTELVAQ